MFGTFTGSSKRPRKVDLSGQRRDNPFSGTSWSPGTQTGPSKSVEDANKQREERQRQRDRLRATLRLQKVWRGHRARSSLRRTRRHALDQLYSGDSMLEPEEKLVVAVPLILALFQASHPADISRLGSVTQDLLQTNFSCFQSEAIHPTRLNKLARILIASLERIETSQVDAYSEVFLMAVDEIIRRRPQSIEHSLGAFYKAMAKQCRRTDLQSQAQDVVRRVTVAPLVAAKATESFRHAAYKAFAWSFLTQANITFFETNTAALAAHIELDMLSESLLDTPDDDAEAADSESGRLWLLAHLIGVQRAKSGESLHLLYLKALYTHLAALSTRVRDGVKAQSAEPTSGKEEAAIASFLLPPYVLTQLKSLPNAVEIENLLDKFTLNHNENSRAESNDASFLAGYILTLVHCFPESGDDIRMRLYHADISTAQGRVPAVKFFWTALNKTSIFSVILSGQEAAHDLLAQLRSGKATSTVGGSTLEREWRTALLFLELYIFVLRLTDDEDFFNGLRPMLTEKQPMGSRIRASAFSLEETTRLSLFLRNLCFTLHWYGPDLLKVGTSRPSYSIDGFLTGSASRSLKDSAGSIAVGIDFNAFKDLVTTAVQMLYERDSRRRFLPQDHWLMKEKFKDLDEFLQAVIVDFEQQQLGDDEEDEDEDGDDGQPMEVDEAPRFSTYSSHLQSLHARLELQQRHKKASVERNRKAASPRLNILRNMPFVIPFNVRVQIFRQFVYLDMESRREGFVDPDQWRLAIMNRHRGSNPFEPNSHGRTVLGRHHGEIKRGQLFQDAMKAFYELGVGLKEPIQITFIDKFGAPEAGIDGGGVTKEFLTSVTNEAFMDEEGLFVTNKNNAYLPNPCALDQLKERLRDAGIAEGSAVWNDQINGMLQQYEFLGRIIGKCMYEGILIDIVFAGFFLLRWSSEADTSFRTNINDLRELDEELYQGMLRLKNYDGEVKDLGFDFTIDDQVSAPGRPLKTITRDLLPDGENVPVDNKNRPLYISYVARHRLMNQPGPQTRAFLRGLTTIIDPAWLRMFNQNELQWLVGGDSSEIDVEDLRAHTDYSGPYMIGDDGEEHPTVQLFWQVMHGLEDSQRREVLKYVTSTPRAPLLGFSQLRPRFTIRFGGPDQDRLPSASTCVNLLKLPAYESAAVLKSKLLYAVQAGAGFDLS